MEKKDLAALLVLSGVALIALSGTMFFVWNHMLLWFLLYASGFCALLAGAQIAFEK